MSPQASLSSGGTRGRRRGRSNALARVNQTGEAAHVVQSGRPREADASGLEQRSDDFLRRSDGVRTPPGSLMDTSCSGWTANETGGASIARDVRAAQTSEDVEIVELRSSPERGGRAPA